MLSIEIFESFSELESRKSNNGVLEFGVLEFGVLEFGVLELGVVTFGVLDCGFLSVSGDPFDMANAEFLGVASPDSAKLVFMIHVLIVCVFFSKIWTPFLNSFFENFEKI